MVDGTKGLPGIKLSQIWRGDNTPSSHHRIFKYVHTVCSICSTGALTYFLYCTVYIVNYVFREPVLDPYQYYKPTSHFLWRFLKRRHFSHGALYCSFFPWKVLISQRISEPSCFEAAQGISFLEPAPAPENIHFFFLTICLKYLYNNPCWYM